MSYLRAYGDDAPADPWAHAATPEKSVIDNISDGLSALFKTATTPQPPNCAAFPTMTGCPGSAKPATAVVVAPVPARRGISTTNIAIGAVAVLGLGYFLLRKKGA